MRTISHMSMAGGLGNQLFKLAALEHISKKTGRSVYLVGMENLSPHTKLRSYMDTIFRNWSRLVLPTFAPTPALVTETTFQYQEWDVSAPHLVVNGYMQDWRYVDRSFCNKLSFDPACLSRHPNIEETVFLHIRGGDYVNHVMHDVVTDAYYTAAIAEFPPETRFLVFTNDQSYAESKKFLKNISHEYIHENEIDSLLLMSKCGGGICANSSFSWWGAFLNPSRKLILPSKWYTDSIYGTGGYYFPGCTVLDV